MNPSPGQGLAGRPNALNAQAQGAPSRQSAPPMYRPETMRNMSLLGDEEKVKYERGLAQLWKTHDAAVPGSAEQNEAKRKIGEFGKMLLAKIQQRRQQVQQQQLRHQQPQQQQQPPLPSGQVGQAVPQIQQAPAAHGNPVNAPSQVPATGPQFSQNPMSSNPVPQPARAFPAHIVSHINEMSFQAPTNVSDKAKWLEDIKQRYAKALYTIDSVRNAMKSLDQTLKENQALSPEERKKLEDRKTQLHKQCSEAIQFANVVRKQYASGANQKTVQNGAAVQNGGNQGRIQAAGAQTMAQPGQTSSGAMTAAPANPMQSSTAAVNAAIEAAKKQQLAAGRVPGAVNPLPVQQQLPPAFPPHHPQVQAPGTPTQAQQSPVIQPPSAVPAAPQQIQQSAPPIKIEPGSQPLPAPLNTAAAAAAAAGLQSAGTPTQNSGRIPTPQSATPTTANSNIRPLTHAAAMNLASQQRPSAITAPPAAGPGNMSASGVGVAGAAQQPGYPHAHPAQPQNLQSKLPIPKVLPEKATQMPTPVPIIGGIGSGRPIYSGGGGIGGGVMNQPVLPKTPAYQLDGEGERILNKKKLDELVRQVCGGTAEGQEGNLLTPEVEESVLNMADSFVDNVLHQACRNAKERGSKVLEIRDIQLVLERTYNIRIPGYSSEELRTVRKVQPNSSWIKKMSAVQAAKVVPGKGDI